MLRLAHGPVAAGEGAGVHDLRSLLVHQLGRSTYGSTAATATTGSPGPTTPGLTALACRARASARVGACSATPCLTATTQRACGTTTTTRARTACAAPASN